MKLFCGILLSILLIQALQIKQLEAFGPQNNQGPGPNHHNPGPNQQPQFNQPGAPNQFPGPPQGQNRNQPPQGQNGFPPRQDQHGMFQAGKGALQSPNQPPRQEVLDGVYRISEDIVEAVVERLEEDEALAIEMERQGVDPDAYSSADSKMPISILLFAGIIFVWDK